ncbi:MAG: PD40 domain-containing protein, partial [Chloroflexi bacterium]|nr:PD40 domain-containing protein [Chloroflexota bacterium]
FNKNIPPAVDFVLQRALAKKPEQRFGSVDELMRALENAVRGPSEVSDARAAPRAIPRAAGQRGGPLRNAPPKPKSSNRPFVAIVGTLGALALGAICLLFVFFFGIQPTLQGSLSTTRTVAPATNNLNELASPTRSSFPTITGDASAQATLTPTRRAVIPATRGKIAYSVVTGDRNEAHVIWIADGDGENAHAVIDSASWPALSPDGTKIAYYQLRENGIYTANLDGSARKRVIGFSDVCCVQWSPDSKRIVFFRGNLKIGGKIYTADADGGNISEITTGFNPAWSPDSLRLAFSGCLPNTSVCGILVYDFKTQTLATITRDNGSNPQWSPRGDKIIYQGDDGKGHINVFIVNSDGNGIKQLTNGKSNDGQPVFSRDGNAIYWRSDQNGTAWAIYVMNADGSIPRVLIKNVPVDDLWGRESLSTGP